MAKKKQDPKIEMFKGLNREMDQIAKDKGIDKMIVVEAVQAAFLLAGKKVFGEDKEIEAHYNEEIEEIELFEFLKVVDNPQDENTEIGLEEARKEDPECEIGDEIGLKMNAEKLGRIAAQTAKQVIIQKIRDAETEIIFNEYKDREGELIAGIVRRMERRNLIVDLGRTEAILPYSEQVPREHFRPGDRIQCFVKEINKTPRGAQIVVSRADAGLLVKLFANEVPEIYEGVVTIESAAREPGGRAKISVSTRDSDVDPVGACVGMKGSRVQAVVQELRGEKIDIVPFHPDPARFACNAIAPAEVSRVVLDEKNKIMELIVADDQLSLAIGKKGQNVRLASKLTGWKIDIQSETKVQEAAESGKGNLTNIEGIGENLAELLYNQGIVSPEALVEHPAQDIARITGLDEEKIISLQKAASEWIAFSEQQAKEIADSQAQQDEQEPSANAEQAQVATKENEPVPTPEPTAEV